MVGTAQDTAADEALEAIIRHGGDEKYIVVHTQEDGADHYKLVSLPVEWHSEILDAIECEIDGPVEVMGGGILTIDTESKTIRTYGKSGSFGRSDRDLVEAILRKAYPGYRLDVKVTDLVR